jgi:hypothetical protein
MIDLEEAKNGNVLTERTVKSLAKRTTINRAGHRPDVATPVDFGKRTQEVKTAIAQLCAAAQEEL